MRFSLGSRTGRTLLHLCSYPEPRPALPVAAVPLLTGAAGHSEGRGTTGSGTLGADSDDVVVPADSAPSGAEGSGDSYADDGDSLVVDPEGGCSEDGSSDGGVSDEGASAEGGSVDGGSEGGDSEDGGFEPGLDEGGTPDGVRDPDGVGVETLTDGVGCPGGLVFWSLWPVSPR